MKRARAVLVAALLLPQVPAHAADEDPSPALGHALALVHIFTRIAAEADTPQQSQRAIDEVLAGRNAAANEAAAGLLQEVLKDVPAQHRATFAAIARDLATVARKNAGTRPPAKPAP